jgi:hypothetical protein
MGYSVFPSSSGGAVPRVYKEQIFNSSGTWTYPTSTNFTGEVEVTVVGGGGSGGGWNANGAYNYQLFTGGGAGGQVLSKERISVYGKGNQTVIVGAGGTSCGSGTISSLPTMPGGDSYFGNYTAANAIYDPELRNGGIWYFTGPSAGNVTTADMYSASYNNTTQPAYVSSDSTSLGIASYFGNGFILSSQGSTVKYQNYFNEPSQIKSSTSYVFGFYSAFTTGVTGIDYAAYVDFYDINGAITTSQTINASFTPTSSWAKVSATLTTGASDVYARFRWTNNTTSNANIVICGLFAAETASGVTEPVSGNTAGYKWTSTQSFSPTVTSGTPLLYALGGTGGEGGYVWTGPNQKTIASWTKYNGGGYSLKGTTGAGYWNTAGHGGGSGGPAIEGKVHGNAASTVTTLSIVSTSVPVGDSSSLNARAMKSRTSTTGGGYAGSSGKGFYSPSGRPQDFDYGANGLPKDNYGAGGLGGYQGPASQYVTRQANGGVIDYWSTNQVSSTYPTPSLQYGYLFNGKPNTGMGGNGIYINPNGAGQYPAGYGGSGIVIVRWYE